MNFEFVFTNVIQAFEEENIRYGIIGGFALGVMGILRSTIDLNLLLMIDDLKKADRILTNNMYTCIYTSERSLAIFIKYQRTWPYQYYPCFSASF